MKRIRLALLWIPVTTTAVVARAQDTTAIDTSYVEYSDRPISLPLGVGLRVPTYDRVNGVSVPWGPKIETSNGRIDADVLVRYRSHLGNWDPSFEGLLRPGDANELRFFFGTGTFSNDTWIRSDLMNSLAAFFVGSDARNYYRSNKASVRLTHAIMAGTNVWTPFIGVNYEQDWSTSDLVPIRSPWSVFGRTGRLRMRRGNPPIDKGHIASFSLGTGLELAVGDIDSKFDVQLERSIATQWDPINCVTLPAGTFCVVPRDAFTQGTFNGSLKFPTFGTQTFTFTGHGIWSTATMAPAQRFGYLGGAGTLATVDLLALGGDRLLFLQGDYMIPLDKIQLPYLGNPFIAVRYGAGNAGVGTLPSLIQNLGIGVGASFFRVDFSFDPAKNRSPFSHRSAVTFGADLGL